MRSWIIFISLLLVLSTVYLHGEEALADYVPEELHIEQRIYSKEGWYPGTATLWKEDGNLYLASESPTGSIEVQFTKEMEVERAYIQYLDDMIAEQSGYKEFSLEKTGETQYHLSFINLEGNEKSTLEELSSAMDFSVLTYKLQPMIRRDGVFDTVEVELFNAGRQQTYMMELNTSERTLNEAVEYARKYDFPQEAIADIPPEKTYLMVEGQLTGIAARFYPHHFYFLLDPEKNYQSVLEWGANPRKAYFIYNQYP